MSDPHLHPRYSRTRGEETSLHPVHRTEGGEKHSRFRVVIEAVIQAPVSDSIPQNSRTVPLEGELSLAPNDCGVVIFAHGSGSSRHSPRNKKVAAALQDGGVGTLLFDLLTTDEDWRYESRFDIELLTRRLIAAIEWIRDDEHRSHLPIGLFGASTGAAAALQAAALTGGDISAVVSRGGRVDLAGNLLGTVRCPTLFIVGSEDHQVLRFNEEALKKLGCEERHLEVVPGATHLFEEEGALEKVTEASIRWFQNHLRER